MSVIGNAHARLVFSRRVRVLAQALSAAIPDSAGSVLDIGCGDGTIDRLLMQQRPELSIVGVDVLVRPETHIPVHAFDGTRLPFPDKCFDAVMFADVLHHTDDPTILLREAQRVARHWVVLKDHTRDGALAYATLRLMDWVGNAHHGVRLPYNYWTRARWTQAFARLGLPIVHWQDRLGLYPRPADWVFGRRLHFVACLGV